jgi:hypothetical protein
VNALEVYDVNGEIDVTVDGSDPITAGIERGIEARDQADAEANIDRIVVSESLSGGALRLEAGMPVDDPREYWADFDVRTAALDSVELHVANGVVAVTGHAGDIVVEVANGPISVSMPGLGADDAVTLSSSNGVIELTLPADVSATFSASTLNGTVDITGFSDLTLTTDTLEYKSGTLGAGEATITLSVDNGTISILAG